MSEPDYRCPNCGIRLRQWAGRCPRCRFKLDDLPPPDAEQGEAGSSTPLRVAMVLVALFAAGLGYLWWTTTPAAPKTAPRAAAATPAPGAAAGPAVSRNDTLPNETRGLLIPAGLGEGTSDPAASRSAASAILQRTPDDPGALVLMGSSLLALGRPSDAISYLERASHADATRWQPLFLLARARGEVNDWAGAAAALKGAQGLASSDPALAYDLGYAAYRSGDDQTAVQFYTRAIELNAGDAIGHRSLGISLDRSGHAEEAVREYQEYLRLEGESRDAPMIRARIQRLHGGGPDK